MGYPEGIIYRDQLRAELALQNSPCWLTSLIPLVDDYLESNFKLTFL
jgi:hypothetical protein